jgi:hypothetical protein
VVLRIATADPANPDRIGLVSVDARPAADGRPAPHTTPDVPGGTPLGYVDAVLIVGRPGGTVVAVPVDLPSGRQRGEPAPVLDQVFDQRSTAAALARDGTLVYVRGRPLGRLMLVDERGAVVGGATSGCKTPRPASCPA